MRRPLQYINILIFILLAVSIGKARDPYIFVRPDSSQMKVGTQQNVRIGIYHASSSDIIRINEDVLRDAGWEIIRSSPLTHLSTDEAINSYKDITITAWESGFMYLPPIHFSLSANGNTINFTSDSIRIMVIAPGDLDALPRELKDIYRTPYPVKNILYIAGGVLLLFLLIFLIYKLVQRRKKAEPTVEPVIIIPPDPAHIIALARLDSLKTRDLITMGEIDRFQSELTHIIRQFLGKVYKFNALESTTEEVLHFMEKEELFQSDINRLGDFLRMADLVKFAKAEPGKDFHNSMMDFAYLTVHKLSDFSEKQHELRYGDKIKEEEE